jgi:hypothetical protein
VYATSKGHPANALKTLQEIGFEKALMPNFEII